MPQLGQYQYLLDTVFFLYPDEEHALKGEQAGGTGFLVAVPSDENPFNFHHLYAITNWHVAVQGGSSVLRLNGKAGSPIIIPTEPHEWEFIPNSHDIAALQISLDVNQVKAEALIASSFCLAEGELPLLEINAGEDVFTLGRFVDYDGTEANSPAMRFGNISIMRARVKQPTGFAGDSIVVDMHSRTGFSGSPVFVYRTSGSIFPAEDTLLVKGHMMRLLGILWGQFPEDWDIVDGPAQAQEQNAVLDGKRVRGWSGMSLVSPSWAITELLNVPALVAQRAAVEAAFRG